ncbi:hypothetical protein M422DRAFT_274753 [Sphaerobolus stellatus SS14]|uniref:PKS/mFAS DH domain-containing protein n=1 Tax=Sphaerobolus stellatus (strain SS14) TaxID=990650 RepID=A0A0C9UG96_SPHS4|nr:hypothetical protein M422DRAFT_274753 [Sphaerobolus stellatus SS14]
MDRCKRVDITNFYEELKTFAEYGPAFQRVMDAYQGENEVLVRVRGEDVDIGQVNYLFRSNLLSYLAPIKQRRSFTLNEDTNVYYLPSKVGKLVLHPDFVESGLPDFLYTHIVYKRWTPKTIVADFFIVALDGTHLCTLTEVEVERHESTPISPVTGRYDVVFQPLSCQSRTVDEKVTVTSDREDLRELYKYLDFLAADALKKALESNAVPGNELNRVRYHQLAKRVVDTFSEFQQPNESTIGLFREKWPEMMEITGRIVSVHNRIFETSKAAVEVLYKDDIMTRFYKHYDWASTSLAERFRKLVSDLVSSGKRVIKVLEVGSGTGALTRHLVKVMEEFPESIIEFVISDVSKDLIPRMDYKHCQYRSFDLSISPSSQGFEPASFDAILGFHVLHVAPELQPALVALGELLFPGGSLLIGDLRGDSWATHEPGSIWFDFVFGSFAEWFSFTDGRKHCTMTQEAWSDMLHDGDFAHVYTESYKWDPLLFSLEAQKKPFNLQKSGDMQNGLLATYTKDASIPRRSFFYRRGNEGQLRKLLLDSDLSVLTLWLFTNLADDKYPAIGFSRALSREYPDWDIHLAIFEGNWDESSMLKSISLLPDDSEPLLWISDEGKLSVPRVIPSKAPTHMTRFNPSKPWVSSDDSIKAAFVTRPDENHVIIDVIAMSKAEGALRGFVGRVSSLSPVVSLTEGRLVAGIVSSLHLTTTIAVHAEAVACLSDDDECKAEDIAGSLLGLVITQLASGRFVNASSLRKKSKSKGILLMHASDHLAPSLRWAIRQTNNSKVVEVKAGTPADIVETASRCDLIISGSQDPLDEQILSPVLSRGKRSFFWNRAHDGIAATLSSDPEIIGFAVEAAINCANGCWYHGNNAIRIKDIPLPPPGTLVPSSTNLFDPERAYLLVGGIGGLGIRIALWMYEERVTLS